MKFNAMQAKSETDTEKMIFYDNFFVKNNSRG